MRDRLIELIEQSGIICDNCPEYDCSLWGEELADHLLTNGVIVPPYKVGDKLYYIGYRANCGKTEKYIKEETIEMISMDSRSIYAHIPRALLIDLADLGKSVFLTREEAEQALKERENNDGE